MLKTAKSRTKRSNRGSLIVETPLAIAFIAAVVVPLLIFATNLAFQLIFQSQVAHIANEAARTADEGRYWLGLRRPDADVEANKESIDNARDAAIAMCNTLGLPGASVVVTQRQEGNVDLTVVTVNVNALSKIPFRSEIFGVDFAALFPGNISARGVSAHAQVQPYAVMHIDCPVPIKPTDIVYRAGEGPPLNRGVAVLPAYGFWHQVPRDHGVPGDYLPLGGFKGTAPINNPSQFAAINLGGYIPRNDLIDKIVRNPDGTIQPALPPGQIAPGQGNFIGTAFLKPESYNNR